MSIKVVNKREVKEEAKQTAEEQVVHTHSHHHLSQQERMAFYSGAESASLTGSSMKRVRDLQAANDELQRQISTLRHECSLSADPLKIMNDIEYCSSTIARNTGEILHIFSQNEKRLARIAELERQNINLQQEVTDTMSSFGSNNDPDAKTQFASGYFNAKCILESNIVTLQQLKTAA